MKRTERHHLQENEMTHGLSWLMDFLKKWQKELTIVGGALVLVAVVFLALVLLRSHNQSVQSRIIGEISALAAEVGQKPEKLAELEKLADKGSSSRLANLELAKYWIERSDWTKAESALGRIPGSRKDLLYYQAEDLKARVALGTKAYDKAIAIYIKVRDEKPKVYPLDAVLFGLAESYELKGDTQEALDIYKKLQEDYAQTYFGYEASLKVNRLGLQK
jgi:tetratricopeptide (TPR) repeat protein